MEKKQFGNDFFGRIEYLLDMMNINKARFYSDLNLSRQSITNWKRGSVPASDTFLKIVGYLKCSPEFLIYGYIENPESITSSQKIAARIEELFHKETGDDSAGSFLHPSLPEDITEIDFLKWKKGMAKPSYEQLRSISAEFKVSMDYLLSGKNFGKPESGVMELYGLLEDEEKKAVQSHIEGLYTKKFYDREHQKAPEAWIKLDDSFSPMRLT